MRNGVVTGETFFLAAGSHRSPSRGRCAMEWVAYLSGERHGDAPRSVSPVLAGFARSWNDALDDGTRQRLRPFLARTIGTADDGCDDERAWACADWLARVSAPAFLRHADLPDEAARLRDAPPLTDTSCRPESLMALGLARRKAAILRRTCRVERLRGDRGGAVDAAQHATRLAPRVAGWNAARAAIRGAEPSPSRDAIADVAWHIGWDAAWAAAWRDGCQGAARMLPVALRVQTGAFELLERMLPTVRVDLPHLPDAELHPREAAITMS
jgi:hypothetical protein